ncbi:MAG: DUF2490 domain-containing protein [Armatimonadota bacterium]
MVKQRWFLAAAAIFLGAAAARADTDSQAWLLLTATGKFAPRVRWYAEFQPRYSFVDQSAFERVLVRGAAGWQATPKWSVWLGLAETPLHRPVQRGEVRWFQQFLYENKTGNTRVTGRTRLEQRSIAGTSGVSHRVRTQWRVARPVSVPGGLQAVAYDEAFWNLNGVTGGPEAGFDRNRTFLGVTRPIAKGIRAECGWLREDAFRRGGGGRRIDALVTQFHFDL